MDVKQKFTLLTNHLVLEKEKKKIELERFINDNNLSIEHVCDEITNKLNDYRNSMKNLDTWMELIEPVNNPKEGNE